MASIAHTSAFKATSDSRTLSLTVQHFLQNHGVRAQRGSSLQVGSQNPLVFTVSGSTDGISATHGELLESQTTNYLLQFLRKHASELGLHAISDIAYDNENKPCFSITFIHSKPLEATGFTQTTLQRLHLDYKWKTYRKAQKEATKQLPDICDEPFSPKLTLPLQALLEDVVIRFVKLSLVKRYPFIFGSWARQFSNEALYFQSIITSINNMLKRSFNETFRSRCEHLLKLLRTRDLFHTFSHEGESYSSHDRLSYTPLTVELAFYFAMQSIYKAGLRHKSFTNVRTYRDDLEEEDILSLSSDSAVSPLGLNARSHRNSELFLDDEFQLERLSFTGPSTPGPFFLDSSHAIDTDHDLLALDTDDDAELDLIDTEGCIFPGFGLHLSESGNEQDCSQDSAQVSEIYSVDSSMVPDSSLPRIKQLSIAAENGRHGRASYDGRCHSGTTDGASVEIATTSTKSATGVEEGSYSVTSPIRERFQSGGSGTSQARVDPDHMVYLTEWGLRDSIQSSASLLHGEYIFAQEPPSFGSPSTPEVDFDFFAPTPEEPSSSAMHFGPVSIVVPSSYNQTPHDEIFDIWSEFPLFGESDKTVETGQKQDKSRCPIDMITQPGTGFCSTETDSDDFDDDFILEIDIGESEFLVDEILPYDPGDDISLREEDWMEDGMGFPFAD